MNQPWENPNYRNERRRLRLVLLPLLLLVVAAAAFLLLHRSSPEKIVEAAAKPTPTRLASSADSPTRQEPELPEEITGGDSPAAPLPGDDSRGETIAARQWAEALFAAGKFSEALEAYMRLAPTDPISRGRAGLCLARLGRWDEAVVEVQKALDAQPDNFAMRKWLAQALYRQNQLEPALEQVRAALALQVDEALLELQAKLEKEIRVQRNYDHARTANFVVLFDGYEHDEMKHMVLDILKSAYAEIGKELDYFPRQPISVILYTGKDFSDVTRAPEWAGGMFGQLDGKIRVPVQGAAGRERALRRVLNHEYTHALLFAMAPNCPFWLQEGLAQYCSGDQPVNAAQVIPLKLLAKGFPREPRAAMVAYLESLQVVEDLVSEYGMARLRRLLGKLGDGSDLEAAFATAYGQPFSRWAEQWRPVTREE
ncbi:MAG: tetratricopeptide repeat protein [Candidatus Aminicenantes bacterium]|nr:tetratricopeptide repeat protein [Candidatus Aminicenantes bacterium]